MQYSYCQFSNSPIFYFIDNFIYEHDEYYKFRELIHRNHQFYPLTKDWKKNLEKDNIEFYLISDGGKSYLLSLFDPYDYLHECEVLDIYEFKPDDINTSSLRKI